MWALSRDGVPTRPLQKIDSKTSIFAIFSPGRNFYFLIFCQKARTWIFTISETLFWKGSKPIPLLGPENRLWEIFIFRWTTVNCTILMDERKIERYLGHLMEPPAIFTWYCPLGLLVFRMERKTDERTKLLEQRGGQNIFHEMWGKMDLRQLFSLFNE
jgi:hypothetical protein